MKEKRPVGIPPSDDEFGGEVRPAAIRISPSWTDGAGCALIGVGGMFLGLLVLALLAAFAVGLMKPFGGASLKQSQGPISLAEARGLWAFDFPDSAHDIQFYAFSEWIAHETLVRFEAPVEDCIATARRVLKAHHEGDELAEIEPGTDAHVYANGRHKAPWFDPESIRSGRKPAGPGYHRPMVWVDTERGVFYYLNTD